MISATLVLSLASAPAFAQSIPDGSAWRALAEQLEGGVAVDMRLRDGQHFKATFIAAHPDDIELTCCGTMIKPETSWNHRR